ncbi:MAG: cyclophane-containing peptide 2OG-Fe(II) oxygenase YhhC [Neisseria sp.]|nr:cyclophane-containing peptide 2OG-Fe(II) oxygenase YhhC [Neisseria sp.]
MKINPENIQIFKQPYPFARALDFLDKNQAIEILKWFENAPWHLTVTDFYSQYEFSLDNENVPNSLNYLISSETKQKLVNLMSQMFDCTFKNNVDVVAHRLSDNQVIKIHNDYIEEADFEIETHRLLIQLNYGWIEENGGFLMIFASNNAHDIVDAILPEHRSMFAFEISPNSHHAVSQIHAGLRYTLIFNFYADK